VLIGDRKNSSGSKGEDYYITVPKMKLVVAVNSVRLARKVRESLRIPPTGTRYFTDSSAVLKMLKKESSRF
jgi:hypothetical protein